MNKKLFFIPLAILMLSACQQSGYKISGTIENPGFFDSTMVVLSERINREWVDLDSTVVLNGSFAFEGKSDSAKVCYLRFKTISGDRKTGDFILENGKMTASMDSSFNVVVKGTPQNDVLAQFYSAENQIQKKANEKMKEIMPENTQEPTPEMMAAFREFSKVINKELKSNLITNVMNHVNTLAGSHIFMSNFYGMTTEEKDALFAKMDVKTKAIPRIAELMAATEVEKKTAVGQPYVNFTLTTPDEKEVSLSDFIGKTDYLLIDFWASWCGPCIRSFPELTAFYAKNKGSKFEILGVSLDKEKPDWTNAILKYGLTWKHVSDLKDWDSEAARLYAVNSIPATVLIDKNGKIVGRNLELDEMQNLLNQQVTK